MSYEYPATAAERKAEALLRSKGWSVTAPLCPVCHGRGYLPTGDSGYWSAGFGWGSASTVPCTNGCPSPVYFFNSGTTVFRNNTIVADGTQGMRRGE